MISTIGKGGLGPLGFVPLLFRALDLTPKENLLFSIKNSLKTITKGLSSNADSPSLLSLWHECVYTHLSVEATVDVGCSSVLILVSETGPLSEPVVCNFA